MDESNNQSEKGLFYRTNEIYSSLDRLFNRIIDEIHGYHLFDNSIEKYKYSVINIQRLSSEISENEHFKELFYNEFYWMDNMDYFLRGKEEYKSSVNDYISQCIELGGLFRNYRNSEDINFRPFIKWTEEIEKVRLKKYRIPSWVGLLYIHQRISQLLDFVELYDNQASKKVLTWKYLFEQGLKQLRINRDDYLKRIFLTSELFVSCNFFSRHVLYHFCFKSSLGIPRIDWVDDESEKKIFQKALFNGVKYAELAYRKKIRKGSQATILEPYVMSFIPKPNEQTCKKIRGRFHLQRNFNGFIGYRKNKKATTIIVGYSGTEPRSLNNWWTNFKQYIGFLDVVYVTASGLLNQLWDDKLTKKGFHNAKIRVYGHSLGGGLMQFAVSAFYKEKEMSRSEVFGYGYNSAGLSAKNVRRVFSTELKNICHLHLKGDIVFKTPFTYQLGKSVNVGELSMLPLTAHSLDTIRECNPDLKTKNKKAFLAQ